MKSLKKIREDNYASNFSMGRVLGVGADVYKRLERVKVNDLPPSIAARLEDIGEIEDELKEYYKKQEEFYTSNSLVDIAQETNRSPEMIADETITPVTVIKDCVFGDKPFPDSSTKDNIIDYFMFLKRMHDQEKEHELEEANNKEVEIEEEEVVIPDLPADTVERDNEIVVLSKQLEWYEQIIDTISKLVDLASKSN